MEIQFTDYIKDKYFPLPLEDDDIPKFVLNDVLKNINFSWNFDKSNEIYKVIVEEQFNHIQSLKFSDKLSYLRIFHHNHLRDLEQNRFINFYLTPDEYYKADKWITDEEEFKKLQEEKEEEVEPEEEEEVEVISFNVNDVNNNVKEDVISFKSNLSNNGVITTEMKNIHFNLVYDTIYPSEEYGKNAKHKCDLKKKFLGGNEKTVYKSGNKNGQEKLDYQLIMFNKMFRVIIRQHNII